MKIVNHEVSLEWITPSAKFAIEKAGRTCYKSEDKAGVNPGAFIQRIIASGHHSVLEHASASFRIITDRGVTHEIVRHRIASYSQESTRYCNYTGGRFDGQLSFIRPVNLPESLWQLWEKRMEQVEADYKTFIASGARPQEARSILPNCLKTEIVMTANFREWRHFIELRAAPDAHPDMRAVAKLICDQLVQLEPEVFGDLPK